jgi:hypothetical protein
MLPDLKAFALAVKARDKAEKAEGEETRIARATSGARDGHAAH